MGIRYLDEEPQTQTGSKIRYLDEPPPQPATVDPYKQVLDEMPWAQRQLVAAGGQLAKAGQGIAQLFGAERDAELERAAAVSADEAPVGAIFGDIAKFAPAMLASGVAVPAAIAGVIGAATDPTDNRVSTGLWEAGMSAVGGKIGEKIPIVAGKLRNIMPTQEGIVGRSLPSAVSRFLPAADDRMYGSLDRAREAVQQIYGGKGGAAAQRLEQVAGQDIRTAQALAGVEDAGARAAVMESLLASKKGGITLADEAAYRNQLARQEAVRQGTMNQVAGGASATETMAARAAQRKAIEGQLAPIRERILQEANVGGKVIAPFEREADALLRQADELEAQARAAAQRQMPAADLIERARLAREAATQKAALANEVTDYGYRPIDMSDALSDISKTLSDPNLGVSVNVQKVLSDVSNQIGKWVNQGGGVIDAKALYGIRKSGVNEAVDQLLAGNPKASKKLAASLSEQLKPLIDSSIENAGGVGWTDFIKQYGKELTKLDEAELLDKARQLYLSPDKTAFLNLVKGESPDVVKKIMAGKFDIGQATTKMPELSRVAGEVARDQSIAAAKSGENAKRTMAALENVLADKSFVAKLPNLLNRYVVLANAAIAKGEMKLNTDMYRELEKAMQDPQAMLRLIEMSPPEVRSQMVGLVQKLGRSGGVVAAGAGESVIE